MHHIKKFKLYYLLGIIFFLASFRGDTGSFEDITYIVPPYIAFVQAISKYIVIIAMIISLLLSMKDKFKYQSYYKDTIYFLCFFIIVILSGNNDFNELIYRLLFSIVTFLYFVRVVSILQLKYVISFIAASVFAFSLVNFSCYFLFPGTVWNGRLFGVTSHPNFTGMAAAISAVFSFYFLMQSRWKIKLFYLLTLFIAIAVCLFTGSRSSIFSLLFSLIVFLFIKLRAFAPRVFLILGSLLLLLLFLNADLSLSSLDYEGRGNTRAGTWKEMSDAALEFPIFGSGKVGATTNSYLFAIVASGIVGFIFFAGSILGFIKRLVSKQARQNIYFPLLCMLSALLFSAAMFEGFLLDQMGMSIFTYWLILVINLNEINSLKIKSFANTLIKSRNGI